VKSPLFRNVAASLAVAGDPRAVNVHNAEITATFMSRLPPPAYPFAVDATRAARGKELFQANCSGCHKPFADVLHKVAAIGTDLNRAKVLNTAALALFLKHFVASVPVDYEVTDANGIKSKPRDLPLAGISRRLRRLRSGGRRLRICQSRRERPLIKRARRLRRGIGEPDARRIHERQANHVLAHEIFRSGQIATGDPLRPSATLSDVTHCSATPTAASR
jgi:hypothetical protein